MSIVVRVIVAFLFVSFWVCMITAWVKDYTPKAQATSLTHQAEATVTGVTQYTNTVTKTGGNCPKKDWVQEYKKEIYWAETHNFGTKWYGYASGLGMAILANALTYCR